MSDIVFLRLLPRMRLKITVHRFRSSFQDSVAEYTCLLREGVEMALAHTIENGVETAYHRDDLPDKLREQLQRNSARTSI